jgi:AbrB family looped-hinge helix DNA binding protein
MAPTRIARWRRMPLVLPSATEALPEALMPVTVTTKGQVTIPKPVRDRLGIKPGNSVDFELTADGHIALIKLGARQP